ncbi:hypothetical protein [Pseudomonas pergaminensis]
MQIFEQQNQRKFDSLMSVISAFGIPRNEVSRTSHRVFDAATAIVFDDVHRLEHILPHIWNPLDLVQAEILTAKLLKTHPNIAPIIDALPKKTSSNINKNRTQSITATGMRLLLGVTSRTWEQFLKENRSEHKKNYTSVDLERLRKPIMEFETKIRERKASLN